MSISVEEIGQVLVTCMAEENVVQEGVVKLAAADTVAPCADGDRFCGVAVSVAGDGYAAVQVKGFVTVACADSTVVPGWNKLVADGSGGVKVGDQGGEILVMSVEDGMAVLCL